MSGFRKKYIIYTIFAMGVFLYISSYIVLENSLMGTGKGKWLFYPEEGKGIDISYVVVHLDLKKTPLKLSYLSKLLLVLKNYGVNALLLEYEDMFPYEGKLSTLKSLQAYKREELKSFLQLAANEGYEIIPLVQTFGHMESVLSRPKFKHLVENPGRFDAICPSEPGSLVLITNILKQVIEFHNSIVPLKHIHIGCDEVSNINYCEKCIKRNMTKLEIYLNHVHSLTATVKNMSKGINVLMWEDMLRTVSPARWNYQLNLPIEPVYWDYSPNIHISHAHLMKYHRTFQNIWVATAFKGADGSKNLLPHIEHRFLNHYRWLETMYNYKFGGENNVYKFKGIILTGWSRYNTFMVPCDLLPSSIPSLILNLLVIQEFKTDTIGSKISEGYLVFFRKYLRHYLTKALQCEDTNTAFVHNSSYPKPVLKSDSIVIRDCKFDGWLLYKNLKDYINYNLYLTKAKLKGNNAWRDHAFLNYSITEIRTNLKNILKEYYEDGFISEFLLEYIHMPEVKLNSLKKK